MTRSEFLTELRKALENDLSAVLFKKMLSSTTNI